MIQLLFNDPENNMPCYTVTVADLQEVAKKYNELFDGTNVVNSRTIYNRKQSRIAGLLGEIVFKKIYPDAVESSDLTYDFDYEGFKIDVKCKFRKYPPTPEYEASFFLYQTNKKFNADLYYFMSTLPDYSYVWLCGYIKKDDIMNNPNKEIWRAGEIDKKNGMHFREDTLCLKYKYLQKVTEANEQVHNLT